MKISKKKIISLYIFMASVVTFTQSYVVLAFIISSSVAVITSLFFFGNILVVLILRDKLVKKNTFIIFGLFIIFIPYVVSFLNMYILPSALLLQLFYMSQLLLGALAVTFYRKEVVLAIIAAVFINLFAGLLSIAFPSFFIPLSEINDSRVFYGGRAIGFFLQPNMFGVSNVLLMIAASVFCSKKSFHYLYPILLISVILSFSRSAIGLFIIASIIIVVRDFYWGDLKIGKFIKPVSRGGMVLGVILTLFMISPYRVILDDIETFQQVYSRIEFFVEFSGDRVSEDRSLMQRAYYQEKYIEQFPDILVIGKGIGYTREAIATGELAGNAHQIHLHVLYQGGLYYWLGFIFILFTIFYFFWKNRKKYPQKSYFALQIFIFMFVFSFFSSSLLHMRDLYLVIGLMAQISNHVKIGFIKIVN